MHHFIDRIHDLVASPVGKFWQSRIEGLCYNFDKFFLGTGIMDVVLDTVILILSIRMIIRLQISYQCKGMLCFVFPLSEL